LQLLDGHIIGMNPDAWVILARYSVSGSLISQPGDLSFYYENALVPSVKTGTNTYTVTIGKSIGRRFV